jgi:hypothetical protein
MAIEVRPVGTILPSSQLPRFLRLHPGAPFPMARVHRFGAKRKAISHAAGLYCRDQAVWTAVIKQSGPWWIGWIEEVPGVNCQERTREDLLETLRITLKEALKLNRREALEAAGEVFEEAPLAV